MKLLVLTLLVQVVAQQRVLLRAPAPTGYAGCVATAEQIARRTSLASLPTITAPAAPGIGSGFCDPAYGFWVSRVSDDSSIHSVDPSGKLAFNANGTVIATGNAGGGARLYDINTTTMVVSNGRDLGLVQTPEGQAGHSLSNIWWDTTGHPDAPRSIWMAIGMRIYLASIVPNGTGVLTASMVVDMTSEYPSGSIWRVYPDATSMRVSFAVQDPARGYARLAWYVVDILQRSTSNPASNYSIALKFKNGVDSPNWYTFQAAGGLQLASTYEAACDGGQCVNGYKSSLDLSGQWIVHSTNDQTGCVSPSTGSQCGATTQSGGPFNTFAIQNVATGEIRWAQGNGHFGVGSGRLATMNTAGFGGTCITRPKVHLFSSLSTDAAYSAAANQGVCYLPGFSGGMGYGLQYTNMLASGNTAVYVLSCENVGLCPSTVPPFQDELWTVDADAADGSNGNFKRVVKLYHQRQSTSEFIQPMWSPDGKMIMYVANMDGAAMRVYVVRVAP